MPLDDAHGFIRLAISNLIVFAGWLHSIFLGCVIICHVGLPTTGYSFLVVVLDVSRPLAVFV